MSRPVLPVSMMILGGVLVLAGVVGFLASSDGGPEAADAASATSTTTTTAITALAASPTTTSPTTTRPSTTTAETSPSSTTTVVPADTVEGFVERFATAIAAADVDFLFGRLHPTVVEGFGEDLCRGWVENEILRFTSYQLSGPAQGPSDQSFSTPSGTGVIENAFSAPVQFIYQGQTFDAEAGFALIGPAMYWLGQCR